MQFASPWALLALLLIPIVFLVWRRRQQQEAGLYFSDIRLVAAAGPSLRQRLRHLPLVLRLLALALLVVALARPQMGMEKVYDLNKGIAIEMVVDRSGSMGQEMDFGGRQMSRLDVVKEVFAEFVIGNKKELAGRPNDLIGMIAFARFADTICPLTLAHDALPGFLATVQGVDRRDEDGTAIGDALALAAARLHTAEEGLARQKGKGQAGGGYVIKSKIIILLTDGENNTGQQTPQEGAALAKEWGIKIYAIGVGGDAAPVRTVFGMPITMPGRGVDKKTLTALAETTGGAFRMAEDGEALRAIYLEIDQLEKSEVESVRYMDYREYFVPFALIALGLLIVETILGHTLFRRAP